MNEYTAAVSIMAILAVFAIFIIAASKAAKAMNENYKERMKIMSMKEGASRLDVLNHLLEVMKMYQSNLKRLERDIKSFELARDAIGSENITFDEWKKHTKNLQQANEAREIVETLQKTIDLL